MAMNQHNKVIFIDNQTSIVEDTYLLAALITFDPTISYSPVKNANGKIAFEVKGRISDNMGKMYQGEMAPLNTYVSNLKSLRSIIFAMKNTQIRQAPY